MKFFDCVKKQKKQRDHQSPVTQFQLIAAQISDYDRQFVQQPIDTPVVNSQRSASDKLPKPPAPIRWYQPRPALTTIDESVYDRFSTDDQELSDNEIPAYGTTYDICGPHYETSKLPHPPAAWLESDMSEEEPIYSRPHQDRISAYAVSSVPADKVLRKTSSCFK